MSLLIKICSKDIAVYVYNHGSLILRAALDTVHQQDTLSL